MTRKPWQGRFSEDTSKLMERFSQSVSFDSRLWEEDIRGSIAHARMLGQRGIIPAEDAAAIVGGLERLGKRIEKGEFRFNPALEDIHMNLEAALTGDIGQAGQRLHTARSRNDQVATDLRLHVRAQCRRIVGLLGELMGAVIDRAEENRECILPGYTHMQRAQPVLLAHHLLAWFEMLRRDAARFEGAYSSADVSPLGSGALAGTPHPIDREATAAEMGFSAVSRNSMDAVSDRDFAAEFLFASALCQTHLSRIAEEIVLWSSAEFGFLRLPDALTTGSSMMPQKKNPDAAELVRGKAGRMVGNLVSLLVTLKGLPLTYNRDLQEDKEPLFDSGDTLAACLEITAAMVAGARFEVDAMEKAAGGGFSTATDLADYLVRKGLPFRSAHEAVGRMVRECLERGIELADLDLGAMRSFSNLVAEDVYEAISVGASVARRDVHGGTAPGRVGEALEEARAHLQGVRRR